jgi:serine/threonine-protein kinase HipA
LTFSKGPSGEHQLDICGEARSPARKHLLELASKAGISKRDATERIDRITSVAVAGGFGDLVGDLPIRKQTLSVIEKAITPNCVRLM